ncbi:lysophospholipid acyltransferase family protein [Salegentibacter chungangensis]|uniref:Lysophospholipid acyltransferase family protein n=1 Tax=Salegentibacter chungangensis TaxID=1335724 RepID=A0ABW3NUJ5_9FLAO
MQGLVFWLAYPLLWLISILPFRLFYIVSDITYVLVYHIIGYRKKTVTDNLKLVFPEKPDAEIRAIRKKFYAHMCDMFLEMIKSMSISGKELKRRFVFTNPEELHRLEKKHKGIILMCGHYASYEWMIALQLYDVTYKAFGIYKRIRNRYFDKLVKNIRGKFNGELIPTAEATRKIEINEKNGVLGIYAMISDQSPKWNRAKYWADFMDIKVPVFTGSEKMAREFDMAVTYLNVEKTGRGYYEATLINITDKPANEDPYYITKSFIELLEKQINKAPEYYLWTHKRWKHRHEALPKNGVIID